jgi:NADH:ubiquinone oxidoreductase subunit 4 (subunit M)
MMILDLRTVTFLSVIINLICTLFIVQLWRQNRRRFAGMAFYLYKLSNIND